MTKNQHLSFYRKYQISLKNISQLVILLSITGLSGCSAGLASPAGRPILQVSNSKSFYCRNDFRTCATTLMQLFIEQIEHAELYDIPLSKEYRFTQNTQELHLGDGFFRESKKFFYPRYYIDTESKEAALYSLLLLKNNNYVHFTARFKFAELAPRNYSIRELEIISALAHSSKSCYSDLDFLVQKEQNNQLNREQLISLANEYFNGIENTSSGDIPFHPEVTRTENCFTMAYGRYMQQLQMNTLFSTIPVVRERHLIADPEQGVVIGNIIFDHALGPLNIMSTPMWERFQLQEGQIRYIEAVFPTTPYGISSGWCR